jgi:hypothetical protein
MPLAATNASRIIRFIDVAVMMFVPSAGTLARRHYTAFSSQWAPVLGLRKRV